MEFSQDSYDRTWVVIIMWFKKFGIKTSTLFIWLFITTPLIHVKLSHPYLNRLQIHCLALCRTEMFISLPTVVCSCQYHQRCKLSIRQMVRLFTNSILRGMAPNHFSLEETNWFHGWVLFQKAKECLENTSWLRRLIGNMEWGNSPSEIQARLTERYQIKLHMAWFHFSGKVHLHVNQLKWWLLIKFQLDSD